MTLRVCSHGHRLFMCSRVESFRALKAVRLLRLMKLAKILRASQILSRLQSRLDIDYASLTLASYLAYFLFGAHWLACILHLVASWQRTFYPNEEFITWIDVLELETGSRLDSTVGQYIASLYWATVTMTNMVRFTWLSTEGACCGTANHCTTRLFGAVSVGSTRCSFLCLLGFRVPLQNSRVLQLLAAVQETHLN